jgi:hypothetical protein
VLHQTERCYEDSVYHHASIMGGVSVAVHHSLCCLTGQYMPADLARVCAGCQRHILEALAAAVAGHPRLENERPKAITHLALTLAVAGIDESGTQRALCECLRRGQVLQEQQKQSKGSLTLVRDDRWLLMLSSCTWHFCEFGPCTHAFCKGHTI